MTGAPVTTFQTTCVFIYRDDGFLHTYNKPFKFILYFFQSSNFFVFEFIRVQCSKLPQRVIFKLAFPLCIRSHIAV
jgi:hypothetical protein